MTTYHPGASETAGGRGLTGWPVASLGADAESSAGARWLRRLAGTGSRVQRVPARARRVPRRARLGYGTLSRLLALLRSTTAAGLEDCERSLTERVFAWQPIPARGYDLGPFRLESWSLPHYVPNAGVRLSAPEFVVAYTGGTGPDPALADVGRDADLFIVDATDRYQHAADPPGAQPPMNLTARQAGEAATAAGAHELMLTHFWPGNDRDRSRADAAEAFSGEILIADEGAIIGLP